MGLEALFTKLAQSYREHFHTTSQPQHSAETQVTPWKPRQEAGGPCKRTATSGTHGSTTEERWRRVLSRLFTVLANKYMECCHQYGNQCRTQVIQGRLQWRPPNHPRKRRKPGLKNIQKPNKPKTFRRYAWASLRNDSNKPNQPARRTQENSRAQTGQSKRGRKPTGTQVRDRELQNLQAQQAPGQHSRPGVPTKEVQTPDKDSLAEVDWGEK